MSKNKPTKTKRVSWVKKNVDQDRVKFVSYRHKEKPDPVPSKGHAYWFFDDGKCGPSRRYIAQVIGVYTMKYVRKKMKDLFIAWQLDAMNCCWLYATTSDYAIKCKVIGYDDQPCWFFRTRDGGWFSIDWPGFWMSGELDVSASKIKGLCLEIEGEEDKDFRETNLSQIRDLEMKRVDLILEYEHQRGNFKDLSYGDLYKEYDKMNISEFVGNELERS